MRPCGFSIVFMLALYVASGCTQQPPLTTAEALRPGTGEKIEVPAGSRLIAFGKYPLAPFVVPHDGGMIYVFDTDTSKVVFVTSYAPDSSTPTSGDLSQLSRTSFDTSHNYRVYYLSPQAAAAEPPPPTTLPSSTQPVTSGK